MRIMFVPTAGLFFAALACAQAAEIPKKEGLTVLQAQDLLGGLRTLDQGSVDQCPPAATPPAAPPAPGPREVAAAAQKPCPFKKSVTLLRAMAQNIVALQTADNEFKIQTDATRLEVMAQVPTPGVEQNVKFASRMDGIFTQPANVPLLRHIKWSDLDLGEPPDHNRLPASVIAVLAPIIDDFEQTAAK